MFQVRIHGRGGQGVVTAAEMLALAAFYEDKFAQAFPSFGSERTGAPVVAFCRIDDKEIRLREPITHPDALLIQDATLLHQLDILNDVGPKCYVLINTTKEIDALDIEGLTANLDHKRILTLPATEFALKHVGRPVPNAALLGGFAAMSKAVSIDSVERSIRSRFSDSIADGNALAAQESYDYINAKIGADA
ncbi:MAG: 2-oxoacid:acceptor oxidoreductase family protein [Ferrimicrobium sp.]